MPDRLTPQQRHDNMAAIHGKDTKPEMVVRRWLWSHGFRYRLNDKRLPGKPDVVMRKYKTCIFVNGCFWHGHNVAKPRMSDVRGKMEDVLESSECCKIPKTNREFWVKKIQRNQERDHEVMRKLAQIGWHSITIWECELKPKHREQTLESLAFTLNHILLQDHSVCKKADVRRLRTEGYSLQEEESSMAAEES